MATAKKKKPAKSAKAKAGSKSKAGSKGKKRSHASYVAAAKKGWKTRRGQ